MKEIPLTQGYVALVDDEDFEFLSKHKWYTHYDKGKPRYARGWAFCPTSKRKKYVFMHRVIMGISDPKVQVDHRNGDGFNNQRSNLRDATQSQNRCNMGFPKTNKSGYKGVSWKANCNKWVAQIRINNKKLHLGLFSCPILAAVRYDQAAKEYHGEFAFLNFKNNPINVPNLE